MLLFIVLRRRGLFPARQQSNTHEIGRPACEDLATASTMESVWIGGKKLSQLWVVDLRQELEKRDLDKSGAKAELIERLQNALLEEESNNLVKGGDSEEQSRTEYLLIYRETGKRGLRPQNSGMKSSLIQIRRQLQIKCKWAEEAAAWKQQAS